MTDEKIGRENLPRIRKLQLWHGNETSESLQRVLDDFVARSKKEALSFDEDSVPKPMRFAAQALPLKRKESWPARPSWAWIKVAWT